MRRGVYHHSMIDNSMHYSELASSPNWSLHTLLQRTHLIFRCVNSILWSYVCPVWELDLCTDSSSAQYHFTQAGCLQSARVSSPSCNCRIFRCRMIFVLVLPIFKQAFLIAAFHSKHLFCVQRAASIPSSSVIVCPPPDSALQSFDTQSQDACL